MTALRDLKPGDEVVVLDRVGVFVASGEHPKYAGLLLAIWWLDGRWSFDALDARQDVGECTPSSRQDREHRLDLVKASLPMLGGAS